MIFNEKSSIEKRVYSENLLNIYDSVHVKKKNAQFYSITAAIRVLFMHETINERDISDETRFNFYDTRSIDLHRRMAWDSVFICPFFSKKNRTFWFKRCYPATSILIGTIVLIVFADCNLIVRRPRKLEFCLERTPRGRRYYRSAFESIDFGLSE